VGKHFPPSCIRTIGHGELSRSLLRLFASTGHIARSLLRKQRQLTGAARFASHGTGFWFDPNGMYTYGSIHVGQDVSLGLRPVMIAALSEIVIGDHVMFGPGVTVIGGGHNTTVVGGFMKTTTEKTGNEDLGVVIEDDVWVGTRATILRGVTVGRGAIVGAASVVNKSVPPYAIVGGNPARVLRFRWTVETILRHESELYPLSARLERGRLEEWQARMEMLPPLRHS
jgi:acetyltransferase-like isoleucine patch superfamily enzyme